MGDLIFNLFNKEKMEMKKYLLAILILMASGSVLADESVDYGEFETFAYKVDGACRTPESYIYFTYLSNKGFYKLETDDP
ncbi:MAG: hypothetical protein KDC52_17070, partial [Ignavibacteriae bacterium]|nr:hypothetical protein [Ignavibacteriota bacterium]